MDFFYHFLFPGKIGFRAGPTFAFLPFKAARVNQPGKPFSWPRGEGLLRCRDQRAWLFSLRLAKFPQRGAGRRGFALQKMSEALLSGRRCECLLQGPSCLGRGDN